MTKANVAGGNQRAKGEYYVMSDTIEGALQWLDQQAEPMLELLQQLCNQNSGTFHVEGVTEIADQLQAQYEGLGDRLVRQPTPPAVFMNDLGVSESFPLGPNLLIETRANLKRQFFLCIHMDTVFGPDHPFQECQMTEPGILNGPGVIDAKGGQVVMLYALRAFERMSVSSKVGWRVFLNPDEEIGSLGSHQRLLDLAKDCELGLLFEPVLPDGSMVASRKGSGNFTILCRGRSAHSGRDFSAGRNAIVHLSRALLEIDQQNDPDGETTWNVGRIQGGGSVNMVPDLAVARVNIRATDPADCDAALNVVQQIVDRYDAAEGFEMKLEGTFSSPPKVVDQGTVAIQKTIERAAHSLEIPVQWRNTGGASDGNKLSGIGIPNVDTLGPAGNFLHTDQEYLIVESLLERTKLAALVLAYLADSSQGHSQ